MRYTWVLLVSLSVLWAYHQKEDLSLPASISRFSSEAPKILRETQSSQPSQKQEEKEQVPGISVYKKYCHTCHANGIAGAPKVGNQAQWSERYEQGWPLIMQRALKGYKGMPAKGHCVKCSEQDIKDAIIYMMQESGVQVQP